MALRTDEFCLIRFVLLARSSTKLTGLVSDQTLRYSLTAAVVGGFAIGVGRQRSLMDDALPRNCPR